MGKEFEKDDINRKIDTHTHIYICITESLYCTPETQHCIIL